MAVVELSEQTLIRRLAPVIKLLENSLPELVEQRVDVLGWRGYAQHPPQQGDVLKVRGDRLGDARVLDLDRDGAAVPGDGTVHLPDRGGGDRFWVPFREQPVRRHSEFLLDHSSGEFRAHRRNAVLKPAERPPDTGRQTFVDVAGHLADLHQDAFHRPERLGDVLGGLEREILAQLLALLTRGGEEPWCAACVTRAAARNELQRGNAALQSHSADRPPDGCKVKPAPP